jgi:tetratricopeptide (TPR) repeat protein
LVYYINGYAQKETAAFLDVPTSTVKSRLHTSRQRLKERMIDMVRDTLQSQALPESFTEETLVRAVAEAAALNKAHQFDEAEALLRGVLAKTPPSAVSVQIAALKELNRTLMWGQYEEGRFDERWDELVAHGRAILATGSDDETVYRELGDTLMYIPRMLEAAAHLEAWIAAKGPNPERMGKLAWARACVADYDAAEALWEQHLALAEDAAADGAADGLVDTVSYSCLTLVDAFAAAYREGPEDLPGRAGLMDRAARVAEAGWGFCWDQGDVTLNGFRSDSDWLGLFHWAGLELDGLAQFLIDKWAARSGPEAEGLAICLRQWIEQPDDLLGDWLTWVRDRVAAEDWDLVGTMRVQCTRGFRARGLPEACTQLSKATWELLAPAPEHVRQPWQWGRFDVFTYFEAGDFEGAARVAQRATEVMGPGFGGALQIQAAAALGAPTPPALVRLAEAEGIAAVDDYGMTGWYLVAREAAAAGDKATAVDALRHTLGTWTNPPLGFLWLWEEDVLWGPMADDPEVKALFARKRARVGPIYGQLHYFPGW